MLRSKNKKLVRKYRTSFLFAYYVDLDLNH